MATTKLTGILIKTGSIPTTALGGGVISASAQLATSLPAGAVSSSAQIDYNSITNKLSEVVSSSAQVTPLLPINTISGSTQFKTLTDPFTGSFTGSFTGDGTNLTGIAATLTFSGSTSGTDTLNLKTEGLIFSGSNGITATVTNNTVTLTAPAGTVSASSQVDYNNIQNKLSGVVSSSAQVAPLLPSGTVSSSGQVLLNTVSGTTFSNNAFYFPTDLRVEGNLTAQQIYTEYVSSSVIYESGSTKFGDTTDDVMSVTGSIRVLGGSISGSMTGMFSSSTQIDYNSITNKLSGVVSSSAQTVTNLIGQTVTLSGSQFASIVSGSGTAYRLVVPVGTNLYAT